MDRRVQFSETKNENPYLNYVDITFPCVVLCAVVFCILGVVNITPPVITRLCRPTFIFITMLFVSRSYPLRSAKWQIALAAYFAIIYICNSITRSVTEVFLGHELFVLFFIFASEHIWSRREINLILNAVIFSCNIQAIVVLFSNSLLLHAGSQQHIQYLWISTNRNPIAFALVPGAIASFLMLIHCENGVESALFRAYWTLSFFLCAYDVFAIGCRSAFYSLCMGLGCLIWERVRKSRTPAEKIIQELMLVILIIVVSRVLIRVASGAYSARLFSIENSGREDIWDKAFGLIKQKPVFGGGFDYWETSGANIGTHNTFFTYMLEGGVVALVIVVAHLLSQLREVFSTGSLIPLAFLAETIFHMFTESGMDYYAYLPMILSVIITRYLQYQGSIYDLLNG